MPESGKPVPRTPNQRTAQRRKLVLTLSVCLLLLFLALGALNAFNLRVLDPQTTGQIFFFTAVSALGFLLFVAVLVILVRNVLKLYAEQRSRVLGSRLRTRMVWGAVVLSMVPVSFMFCFSYLLMNRAVERWFSQPAAELRDSATRVAVNLSQYVAANARAEAESLETSLRAGGDGALRNRAQVEKTLAEHQPSLQGGFAMVFSGKAVAASVGMPKEQRAQLRMWLPSSTVGAEQVRDPRAPVAKSAIAEGTVEEMVLEGARHGGEPLMTVGGTDYSIGSAWVNGQTTVAVALPLPYGMSNTVDQISRSAEQYWTLFRLRRQIRATYMLLMLMITALAIFASTWLALHLAKQVTEPVESLAEAMNEIAHGHYDYRVAETATEELGELVHSFNAMAADLDESRRTVEQVNLQIFEANAVSERRRRELETMLEAIPNGVVMLDAERRISVVNRAFCEMLDPGGQMPFTGTLDEVLPADAVEPIDRLLRRSHRMGMASIELEMSSPSGPLHVAATSALLESGLGAEKFANGYVLVLENATELLRAQKQMAWKEVARRVAHEIKNPLTPISLSAEQIRRHIGRLKVTLDGAAMESPSVEVIHRSSEVISQSVESMRGLVDQFSALAQFPNARPRPADLNTVVENSLSMFAGRLRGVRAVQSLATGLPLVMADPEALKRALTNLIDNAAEALTESLVKEIQISTRLSDTAGMVELCVADTGPGVTDEMRENLFLPYFSTKQRGTGLGLTIAAKIVQDHQGSIRVEKNTPTGARFLIDLPVAMTASADEVGTAQMTGAGD